MALLEEWFERKLRGVDAEWDGAPDAARSDVLQPAPLLRAAHTTITGSPHHYHRSDVLQRRIQLLCVCHHEVMRQVHVGSAY